MTRLLLLLVVLAADTGLAFSLLSSRFLPRHSAPMRQTLATSGDKLVLHSLQSSEGEVKVEILADTEEAKRVGNLVTDDEYMGLSMELSELIRVAVLEDIKKNTASFIGKEDYKVGDISKEVDARVKEAVADLRGKEEYELGDLSMALDGIAKDMTCQLTGKDDYEFGDLSLELDKRVKSSVATFCGKDTYEFGDLTNEIDRRAKSAVAEFTAKEDYEFGDVTKEIERRRAEWVKDYLGKGDAEYEFGDITKKALSSFTGKGDYEFGDVSKKILGDLFGPRKRGGKPNGAPGGGMKDANDE